MQCPNPSCQPDPSLANVKTLPNTELVMAERCGVEIDYCPRCRGIWLDRGELDKLLEKAVGESEPAPQSHRDSPQRDTYYARRDDDDRRRDQKKYSGSYKKKSLLSELFDF